MWRSNGQPSIRDSEGQGVKPLRIMIHMSQDSEGQAQPGAARPAARAQRINISKRKIYKFQAGEGLFPALLLPAALARRTNPQNVI